MIPGQIHRDLGAGVPQAHHQDVPILQLPRVLVVGDVELNDLGVERTGELGQSWLLIGGHGHDNVVGVELAIAGSCQENAIVSPEMVHVHPVTDRELEVLGV